MNELFRNYVKLKGNEHCPINYLIPKGAIIQNVYEVLCETTEIRTNYSKMNLNKSNSLILLESNKDFIITKNHLQYKKKEVGENISIYLIIEFEETQEK